MIRISLVLLVLLVISALGLVTSRYEARWVHIELERARQEERRLDVAWRQLQLEMTQHAQHARIDSQARASLGMVPVPPDRLMHWRADAAPGGGS